jgi:hypothetical protein
MPGAGGIQTTAPLKNPMATVTVGLRVAKHSAYCYGASLTLGTGTFVPQRAQTEWLFRPATDFLIVVSQKRDATP